MKNTEVFLHEETNYVVKVMNIWQDFTASLVGRRGSQAQEVRISYPLQQNFQQQSGKDNT